MNNIKSTNNELIGSNRLVAVCVSVESMIIVLAYIMEFVKGARTLVYALGIAGGFAALTATLWIVYNRKKDSNIIKYIASYAFFALYAVVLLTTENTLTFTYAIPIIIMVSAYAETKLSLIASICVIVLNIIQVVYFFSIGVYNGENTAMVEIHVIIVLLITIFQAFTVRRVERNNKTREQRIADENDRTKNLLDTNIVIGNSTNETIEELYTIVEKLDESIRLTANAMHDVNTGATETTKNVELQIQMTNEITNKAEAVSDSYRRIVDSINMSIAAISEGKNKINDLVLQSEKMKGNGNEVRIKLDELKLSVENIESVITIISDIAEQTNLLSLNASVEAARAGEAGKGFAVVASEIQNMANSTQTATGKIANMISDITKAIGEVVNVTSEMINSLNKQEEAIQVTANGFAVIEQETSNIGINSNELSITIEELTAVNVQIVNSTASISTITEQVSAHANATVGSCEKNIEDVEEIKEKSRELRELASKLKQDN